MVIDYVNGECHMLNVSSSIMLSNVESNSVFCDVRKWNSPSQMTLKIHR